MPRFIQCRTVPRRSVRQQPRLQAQQGGDNDRHREATEPWGADTAEQVSPEQVSPEQAAGRRSSGVSRSGQCSFPGLGSVPADSPSEPVIFLPARRPVKLHGAAMAACMTNRSTSDRFKEAIATCATCRRQVTANSSHGELKSRRTQVTANSSHGELKSRRTQVTANSSHGELKSRPSRGSPVLTAGRQAQLPGLQSLPHIQQTARSLNRQVSGSGLDLTDEYFPTGSCPGRLGIAREH